MCRDKPDEQIKVLSNPAGRAWLAHLSQNAQNKSLRSAWTDHKEKTMNAQVASFVLNTASATLKEVENGSGECMELRIVGKTATVWITVCRRSMNGETFFSARTLDQCDLTGMYPSFYVKSEDGNEVCMDMVEFLLSKFAGEKRLYAELFRNPNRKLHMLGSSDNGGKMEKFHFEPLGASGYGC